MRRADDVARAAIRVYRVTLSALIGRQCRHLPSCSEYASLAVREFGPVRGAAKAAWRLLRCNPWSRGGVDYPGMLR